MKRIKIVGKTQPLIRDKGPAQPLVDPVHVGETLEADESMHIAVGATPPSLAALRNELAQRLLSTGGRPALRDTDRRQKIPLSDDDWGRLQELATRVADLDARPAPAQVASALLHLALTNLDAAEAVIRNEPIPDEGWVQREAPRGAVLLRFVAKLRHVLLIQEDVRIDEADCARWIESSGVRTGSEFEVWS